MPLLVDSGRCAAGWSGRPFIRLGTLTVACQSRFDDGQAHQDGDVIVSGDAVVPLELAAEATMDDYLLATWPLEDSDGGHR